MRLYLSIECDDTTKSAESGTCTQCQANEYLQESTFTCQPCPTDATSEAGSTICGEYCKHCIMCQI